jgi:hypothetical protein
VKIRSDFGGGGWTRSDAGKENRTTGASDDARGLEASGKLADLEMKKAFGTDNLRIVMCRDSRATSWPWAGCY